LDCKTTTFLGDKEHGHGLTGPSPYLPQKHPRQYEKSREFYTDQVLAANYFELKQFPAPLHLWSNP
jgi:hypothetical protein